MRIAIRGILAGLAWIGLLVGGNALAQQADTIEYDGPTSLSESKTSGPADLEPIPDGEPEPGILPGESIVYEGGQFVNRGSIYPDGGACDAGPCCAVCGGGACCPANWYFETGVRVITHSKPSGRHLTTAFRRGFLLSDAGDDNVVVGNGFSSAGAVLNTRDLGLDVAAGWTIKLGRYLGRDTDNRDQFLEFEYWGMNRWRDQLTVNGILQPLYNTQIVYTPSAQLSSNFPILQSYTGNLQSPFISVDESLNNGTATLPQQALNDAFNGAIQHDTIYVARMNNFELNARIVPRSRGDRLVMHKGRWRRECQPGHYWSYLFGLRVLTLEESFRYSSRAPRFDASYTPEIPDPIPDPFDPDAYTLGAPVQTADNRGHYFTRTHNDLLGLQFGVDCTFRRCKWDMGVKAKVGPYINFSDMIREISVYNEDIDTNGVRTVTSNFTDTGSARRDVAALIGEVGLHGSYKIHPNLIMRGSYDFLWMTGLALAPEQLIFVPVPANKVNNNGNVYSHGLSLTMECSW